MFAILVSMGAFYSRVKYTQNGIDYEVLIGNDEFEFWNDSEDFNDYESE